jgi:hypothetical protein
MQAFRSHRYWFLGCTLLLAWALAFFTLPVKAQQDGYRLNLNRDYGYSSGSQIRGNFSASIVPQENIKTVTYLIDGMPMAEVTAAPFKLKFKTTDYPEGWHELSAQIQTNDGQTVSTAVRRFEFASSEQESETMKKIVLPLLGGILLITIIGIGAQMLLMRNKPKINLAPGARRPYGLSGGAICPRCKRPFAIHWWALNAGFFTKLDRCDYCGRWGIVRRASQADLAAAEAAELQSNQPESPIQGETEDEKLRQMLDESRFTDKS